MDSPGLEGIYIQVSIAHFLAIKEHSKNTGLVLQSEKSSSLVPAMTFLRCFLPEVPCLVRSHPQPVSREDTIRSSPQRRLREVTF